MLQYHRQDTSIKKLKMPFEKTALIDQKQESLVKTEAVFRKSGYILGIIFKTQSPLLMFR